jgi:putative FmdB family regulatory protein
MPLYEYECTACQRHTEKIQKFSDPEITTCPHCGGTLKRVISAPAISFKGGGWYADGYGNAKPSGESKSGDKKADTASSTTESKPSGGSESSATPVAAPSAPAPSAPASTASSDKK